MVRSQSRPHAAMALADLDRHSAARAREVTHESA
jgi:hypothetical protein